MFFCQYMIVVLWRFHSTAQPLTILRDLPIGENIHSCEIGIENGGGIVSEFRKIKRTVLAHADTMSPTLAYDDEVVAVFRIGYLI